MILTKKKTKYDLGGFPCLRPLKIWKSFVRLPFINTKIESKKKKNVLTQPFQVSQNPEPQSIHSHETANLENHVFPIKSFNFRGKNPWSVFEVSHLTMQRKRGHNSCIRRNPKAQYITNLHCCELWHCNNLLEGGRVGKKHWNTPPFIWQKTRNN